MDGIYEKPGCYRVFENCTFAKPPPGELMGKIVAPILFNEVRMNGEVLQDADQPSTFRRVYLHSTTMSVTLFTPSTLPVPFITVQILLRGWMPTVTS